MSLLKDLIYDIFRMTSEKDIRNVRHREAVKRLHLNWTYKYNFLPFISLISRHFLVSVSARVTVDNKETFWPLWPWLKVPDSVMSSNKTSSAWFLYIQGKLIHITWNESFVVSVQECCVVSVETQTAKVGYTLVCKQNFRVMRKTVTYAVTQTQSNISEACFRECFGSLVYSFQNLKTESGEWTESFWHE